MPTTQELSTPHLLGIKYLSEDDIQLILETTNNFKEVLNRPIKKSSLAARFDDCQSFFLKIQPEQNYLLN
ncbi:MAG: hypothetical protein HC912_01315 [Saprospiraceae bacterium]|nr:hypothetical protein [Saprospiraceae bacterium]